MKRDIRALFKDGVESGKKLPKDHMAEFSAKLDQLPTKISNKHSYGWVLKIAASIALLFTITYSLYRNNIEESNNISEMTIQVDQIEKQYIKQIGDAWQDFINVTNDQNLIDKYKVKLDDLDQSYLIMYKHFQNNPYSITALENLIYNLQSRLQFLKDIVNHINELNENNKTYETIIL